MQPQIKIRWFLHLLLIVTFVIAGVCLYYYSFHSGKTKNVDEVLFFVHRSINLLFALIFCHLIWLLMLLIKFINQRQFIAAVFILLFGLGDIGLIKVMGFLWATTMMA
jgi:Ni,Fe-hydrogenase I cytochrome b subunit